jgi:phosphate transport system substrate-binding protein
MMNRKLALGISLAIMIITTTSIAAFMQLSTPKITISGAWALYPMMVRWSEEYRRTNPDIRIELSAGGAGKGMTDALTGLVDIGMVSREIYHEEVDQGAFWVAVVKDAVVPTMNKANPVSQQILATGLSKSVFLSIYLYENITTWGQAVGRSEIIDDIHVYTRSDSCGAAETWAQYLGGRQEDLKGTGVYGDPGLADAAKNDPLGIGFNNINYAYDPGSSKPIEGLAIIPIDLDGNGILDPDEDFYNTRNEIVDAIAAGTYPAPPSRELNLVTKAEFSATARSFVEWILTEGQQYAVETGYVQLSESRLEEELSKLS